MTTQTPGSMPAGLRRSAFGSLFFALTAGGSGSDATNTQPAPEPTPPPTASKGSISLLDGSLGGTGNRDGAGATARFNFPTGLAVGPQGNLYCRRQRKPAHPQGHARGCGEHGGGLGPAGLRRWPGLAGVVLQPTRIAVGPDASVFVIDGKLRKIDPTGNVRTVAGPATGNCGNLPFREAPAPKLPSAVAVDAFGIAYVADSFAGAIYTLTPDGVVTLLADSVDQKQPNPTFGGYGGIALDGARNLYVLGTTLPNVGTRDIVRVSQPGEVKTVVPLSTVLGGAKDIASDAAGILYVPGGIAAHGGAQDHPGRPYGDHCRRR